MNTQAETHKLKSEYIKAHSIHTSILEAISIQDPLSYGVALLNVAEIDVSILLVLERMMCRGIVTQPERFSTP
jgi:hypothetical protein